MNFIRSGFRIVRQNPALVFAEVAWRWMFGFAAWLLVIFTLRTIVDGIDVSGAEIALTRNNNAYLIADAIIRVLAQVLPRFLAALRLVVPALAVLWTLAATIGRTATLDTLVNLPASETVLGAGDARRQRRIYGFRLFLLNALRAVFTVATFLAFFGTILFVSARFTPRTTPELAPAYMLAWVFLAFLVGCLWGVVNWFLALAPIFIVRDGLGVWKAISASVGLYRDARRDYSAIATWFGLFRGAALLVATFAGVMTLAASLRAGLIASLVIALFYFAIVDWLYIARLAAFVELASPVSGMPPAPVDTLQADASNLKLETET